MKVIFNAPKKEVYDYFRKGGEFQKEMRSYREGLNQRLYWSRIFRPNLIGFNVGFGKRKVVHMWLVESETQGNQTVFKVQPSIWYIILGVLLIPLCLVGLAGIIGYFMKKKFMEKYFKQYYESTISNKFDVTYV